ncbi:unnamed protein product, partial [Brenthis ino]
MFCFVNFCLLFFFNFFILALMQETTGPIAYDKTIEIVYIIREKMSITVRLEDPFDCIKWAGLQYSSTEEIVNSTYLDNVTIKHMSLELDFLSNYSTSGIFIIFNDTKGNTFTKEPLFKFTQSNSRGLDEKHICLKHCTIIFNIKKVLKKYCSDHGRFTHQCCKSKHQTSIGGDSKEFITAEINVEKTNRNSKEESVEIDIIPNDPKFYYKPDINYTFICNASRLPKNMYLLLNLKEAQGNEIHKLSKSKETLLEYSSSLQEKYNNSKIYCEIRSKTKKNWSIKSREITLFLKESKTQQNTSLQHDVTFHMNEYYIGLILGVLCLSVGVILYFYCKFRAKKNALQDTTVYTYATQQEVMYAQLQLDLNKSLSVPPKNERIPYTTIAGVLKPSNKSREK